MRVASRLVLVLAVLFPLAAGAETLCGQHVLRPPAWTVPAGRPAEIRATVEEVRILGGEHLEVDAEFVPWPGRVDLRACVGPGRFRCSSWGTHTDGPEQGRRVTFGRRATATSRGFRIRWGPEDGPQVEATHLVLGAGYSFNFALVGSSDVVDLAPCSLEPPREVLDASYDFFAGYRRDSHDLPAGRYVARLCGDRGFVPWPPSDRPQVSVVAVSADGRQAGALIYQVRSETWRLDPGDVRIGDGDESCAEVAVSTPGGLTIEWGIDCTRRPDVCNEGWHTAPAGWRAEVTIRTAP